MRHLVLKPRDSFTHLFFPAIGEKWHLITGKRKRKYFVPLSVVPYLLVLGSHYSEKWSHSTRSPWRKGWGFPLLMQQSFNREGRCFTAVHQKLVWWIALEYYRLTPSRLWTSCQSNEWIVKECSWIISQEKGTTLLSTFGLTRSTSTSWLRDWWRQQEDTWKPLLGYREACQELYEDYDLWLAKPLSQRLKTKFNLHQ